MVSRHFRSYDRAKNIYVCFWLIWFIPPANYGTPRQVPTTSQFQSKPLKKITDTFLYRYATCVMDVASHSTYAVKNAKAKTLLKFCSSQRQGSESDDRSSLAESIDVDPVVQRTFSALWRLKTYLQTTMCQDRLNHLLLLYCHKARTESIDLSKIASSFVSANDRRLQYFCSM